MVPEVPIILEMHADSQLRVVNPQLTNSRTLSGKVRQSQVFPPPEGLYKTIPTDTPRLDYNILIYRIYTVKGMTTVSSAQTPTPTPLLAAVASIQGLMADTTEHLARENAEELPSQIK